MIAQNNSLYNICMTTGTVSYNGGRLYYQVTGSGKPIVFIHGFTLDHTMWQPQVEFFAKNYQVITYDVRGFGRSSLPNGPYKFADDLHAVLQHLGVGQAHIVGLSMGGRIATDFAIAYPEMVASLSLLDSSLEGYKNEVDWDVHAKEQGIERAKENWLLHEVFVLAQKQPAVVAALRTIVAGYSGWHWLHVDPLIRSDTRNRLHEINKPTLIVVGRHDLQYFHNIAAVLADGIAHSQTVVVPNAGHMVSMEAPKKVNQLLADFILHV